MSATSFDPEDFFAYPASQTLEHVLETEYLLAHGVLPCELKNMPREQAIALLEESRRFARHALGDDSLPDEVYHRVGFSKN